MKRRALDIAAVVSLLVFAAVVSMWVWSFRDEWSLFSWVTSGERYTLRSHWGQLLVVGPPAGADKEVEAIAGRMSNGDFDWTVVEGYVRGEVRYPMVGYGYVQGEVREGTATWEMYGRVRDRFGDPRGELGAAKGAWLRGLEDPERFLTCHLMLLLAEQERWRERWVDGREQPWDDGSSAGSRLLLFMRADESGTRPHVSGREVLRQRWHEVVDEARVRVFHGWLVLGALVAPVAWVARPRREPRTAARCAFNGVALASALALALASAAWVRSYWVGEWWMFASRQGEPPDEIHVPVRAQSWIGSSRGRLMVYTHENPDLPPYSEPRARQLGYWRGVAFSFRVGSPFGMVTKNEQRWSVPGIQYASMPLQELTGPGPTPGTRLVMYYGYRHLVVAWWALVVVSAALPLFWAWRDWRWRRRWARRAAGLCVRCGYDLRASVGRCPECGDAIAT